MAWPSSLDGLSRLEWLLWILAAILAVSAPLVGLWARHVGAQRTQLEKAALQEQLTRAEERANQLEKTAQDSQRELTHIKKKQESRTVTGDQAARIIAFLKDASPKGPVIVIWKLFDEEAEQFGRQVISILQQAGFDTKEGRGPMSFGAPGAWIVVRDLARLQGTPNAVGAIQTAFRDIAGISFDGQQRKDPFPDLGETVIAIGPKP